MLFLVNQITSLFFEEMTAKYGFQYCMTTLREALRCPLNKCRHSLKRKLNWSGIYIMSVDSHNKFLQSDQNVLSRLLLAQQARQHALAAEERRYVPRVDTLKIILALALVPVSYQVVAQEMQMFDVYSTAEKLETSWDFVMEVEHKSAVDLYKTSSCLSSEEFINEFPISDHTGL